MISYGVVVLIQLFVFFPYVAYTAPKLDPEVWELKYEPNTSPDAQTQARFSFILNGKSKYFELNHPFSSAYVSLPLAYVIDNQCGLYVFHLVDGQCVDRFYKRFITICNGVGPLWWDDFALIPVHIECGQDNWGKRFRQLVLMNVVEKKVQQIISLKKDFLNMRRGDRKVFIFGSSAQNDVHYWIKCFDIDSLDFDSSLSGTFINPRNEGCNIDLIIEKDLPWLITYDCNHHTQVKQLYPKSGSVPVKFEFSETLGDRSYKGFQEFPESRPHGDEVVLFVENRLLYAWRLYDGDDDIRIFSLQSGKRLKAFRLMYSSYFPFYPSVQRVKDLRTDNKLNLIAMLCPQAFVGQNISKKSILSKDDLEFYSLLAKTASHAQDLIYRYLPYVYVLDALSKTTDNKFITSTEGQVVYPLLLTQLCRQLWYQNTAKAKVMVALFLDLNDPDVLALYQQFRPQTEWSALKERASSLFLKK